jgi:hypothetical protein
MKRRNWLLALLGISGAKALPRDRFAATKGLAPMTPQASDLNYDPICPSGRVFPRGWKPVNGRCPVCGTMAEEYSVSKRMAEQQVIYERMLAFAPHSHYAQYFKPVAPKPRQVRCKTCNAAFFQDAEK